VAPAEAIHTALESNLKIVRDWLNDGDFASAAETAEGLVVLAEVYRYQSGEPRWREQTRALRRSCTKLVAAAKTGDADACAMAAEECARLLRMLAQDPPSGEKVPEVGFKPTGSMRVLMKLLDGTYADAKGAKTPRELEHLAYTLAEASNVASYLRSDPRWRDSAFDARAAALRAAAKAREDDLTAAKAELKSVHNRCEACHQRFQR
jgi:hypothetical protein